MTADVVAKLLGATLEYLDMESSRLLLGSNLACVGDLSVLDGDAGKC